MSHPSKFEPHNTTECSLCHGHFAETPYLKLELETWDGPDAVLCARCINTMRSKVIEMQKAKKVKQSE